MEMKTDTCWICKRTAKQVKKDAGYGYVSVYEFDVVGMVDMPICNICEAFIEAVAQNSVSQGLKDTMTLVKTYKAA